MDIGKGALDFRVRPAVARGNANGGDRERSLLWADSGFGPDSRDPGGPVNLCQGHSCGGAGT